MPEPTDTRRAHDVLTEFGASQKILGFRIAAAPVHFIFDGSLMLSPAVVPRRLRCFVSTHSKHAIHKKVKVSPGAAIGGRLDERGETRAGTEDDRASHSGSVPAPDASAVGDRQP